MRAQRGTWQRWMVAMVALAAAAATPGAAAAYQNPIASAAHGTDPTVLRSGSTYYLFSSFTGAAPLSGNVPLQRSTDLSTWTYFGDALPSLPAWADALDAEVRGPATLTRPSLGRYLLYFSARHRNDGSGRSGRRCIGVVASASPNMLLGGAASLIPTSEPLLCLTDRDAFDPFVFTAYNPNGDPYAWLLWVERRDGQPDVIQHRLLTADGASLVANVPALPLLTADTFIDLWDAGRLANPALVRDPGTGLHYLFYSANDSAYSVDAPTVQVYIGQSEPHPARYGTGWATCTPTPYGVFTPCSRSDRAPWLRTQNAVWRPGNADFFFDAAGKLWTVYDASIRNDIYLGVSYEAPTLRLDKVCFSAEAAPRTNAPTTSSQSNTRATSCPQDVQLLAEPWPEADQLFRQDPRWRGGDGAWSIDLGGARTLWIFGDSFIDPEGQTRESSFFVRNSIAIQQGSDPSTAQMTFYWKTTGSPARPTAFFPNSGASNQIWYWGGAGAVVDDELVIFQLGYFLNAQGDITRAPTKAVVIPNYTADPSLWQQQWYDVPADPSGYIWDPQSARVAGTNLHVYVTRPAAATGAALPTAAMLRFPKSNIHNHNFASPRWWNGSSFVIGGQALALWEGSTQYTVHNLPSGGFVAIMGAPYFGPGTFATAAARTGPFSPFSTFYTPPDASWGDVDGGVLTYLWHGHPQLTGAEVVATYSTHGRNVIYDASPYYPKFARFTVP